MPIIADPKQRMERAEQKKTLLLRFLREELYTTPHVAAKVMGVAPRAARATVAALEAAGFVKRHRIPLVPGLPPLVLIGITPSGQSMAFDPSTEVPIERSFEPGRFSLNYLKHTLETQQLRIQAQYAGITKWVSGDRMAAVQKGIKKPDAVALDAAGRRVAIEVERSVKGPKSYADVLAGHLTAMHQNKWQRVIWSSPDAKTRDRVKTLILAVKRVRILGIDTRIDPAKHHQNLAFCEHKEFVHLLT
ncbi:MAG: hypothetical protein HKL99_00650 [Burkholderiales bacterium]|nr:hypothetical protein [Burkholderiales bacterium]